MDETLTYYNQNAEAFIEGTREADMSEQYDYSTLDFTFDGVSASSVGIKLCHSVSHVLLPRVSLLLSSVY